MNIRNWIIGWKNTISNTYITLTRQKFEVTQDWFNQLFNKHFTTESSSKFNSSLFEDQKNQGSKIVDIITNRNKELVLNEIRILKGLIRDFVQDYDQMLTFFKREKIIVNQKSIQHKQFELFLSVKSELAATLEKFTNAFENNDIEALHTLEYLHIPYDFDPIKFKTIRDYKFEKLGEYPANERYLENPPNEIEWHYIEFPFRDLKKIEQQLNIINHFKSESHSITKIITGDAGMGKSNLSAFLTLELRELEYPVIFIRAKAFSGNPDEFESIFLRELDVPTGYNLSEILDKINDFGKSNKKRVTIIIDALNETTYQNHGFSSIWRNHLDNFLSRLQAYRYIYFIATLRNSYVDRVWPNSKIKYDVLNLKGFDGEVIESVVRHYFDEYNISHEELHTSDIFYFRTPLLLFLYCEMLNPKRKPGVYAILGLKGFQEVFEKYIENLSEEIVIDLNLISTNQVNQGFSKVSDEMLNNVEAFIEIVEYYNLFEGEAVKTINNSIGHKVLEGYLIYVKDSINKTDVVTHTQQEVGGYLLAKELKSKYTDIVQLTGSDFFQNRIIGQPENKHQLADDILKFLITDQKALLSLYDVMPKHEVLNSFVLSLLQREFKSSELNAIKRIFVEKNRDSIDVEKLFKNAEPRLFDSQSELNLMELSEILLALTNYDFDLLWTKYLYDNWAEIENFLVEIKSSLNEWKNEKPLEENDKLFIEILLFTLESTNRNQRDKASILLLEIAEYHLEYFIQKLEGNIYTNRLYILERLSSIIYGVFLRRQNDFNFLQNHLTRAAQSIYNNQFSNNPTNPVWHYVVIDNYKHIIDLALLKGLISLTEEEIEKLNNYNFVNDKWIKVSGDRIAQFNECGYNAHTVNCPDPFRMDFVIYTVPRLIEEGNFVKKSEALANIYQKLINDGYLPKKADEIEEKSIAKFYFGTTPFLVRNKVDRLGKKYSWNAFFEYAGYLIQQNQLTKIWSEYDTTNGKPSYERLGDVEFEVSNPRPVSISEQVYTGNLLDVKSDNENWVNIEKHDVFWDIWRTQFDEKEFTLLYGYIENKPDANYEIRSFLVIDSFLIKKSEAKSFEKQLHNQTIDWEHELYGGKSISRTYFGELYWADNIPDVFSNDNTIYLDEFEEVERPVSIYEILEKPEYRNLKPGDIIKSNDKIQLHFNSEPTIADYLWETDRESGAQDSYRDNIPSPQIGKYLNLKADAINFQLLDEDLNVATKSVNWEHEGKDKQQMNFLRSDLLQKYMDENDLVLLYEVRQFTHDQLVSPEKGQVDMRKIKYLLPHLNR